MKYASERLGEIGTRRENGGKIQVVKKTFFERQAPPASKQQPPMSTEQKDLPTRILSRLLEEVSYNLPYHIPLTLITLITYDL